MSDAKADCKEVGRLRPVIDRNKCEGKEECVKVCPYSVFEMGTLSVDDRKRLSLVGRLKAFGHRYRQAFTPRADVCHACGLCVTACPEKAITLAPLASFASPRT
jgi:NAD-dependent dihydropyrimidine dehydrogenase PreA subunit